MGRQLGDGAPGESQRLVAERPVVKLDGVEGAEAVDALKMVCWHLETRGALDEGAVGQLEGRVQRDRSWQSLAAHSCCSKSCRSSEGNTKKADFKA